MKSEVRATGSRSAAADDRVSGLDGVRALAVLAVLAFHGGLLPGGFLGVDAFFVLSGYLITALLVREYERSGRIMLGAFWARRARRLLPALLVVIIVVCAVSRAMLPAEELTLLRGDAMAALGYLANWRMILRGNDYFAQMAVPSPLQHTWSLGIEEQFYVLWPLVLVLVLRGWQVTARRPTPLLVAAVFGVAASFAVGWVRAGHGAQLNRLYFGSDTRAVSVLVGAALAAWLTGMSDPKPSARRWLGVAAAAGAVVTAWLWTHAQGSGIGLYRGGLLLAALAVAVVLAHVVQAPTAITARLLSLPPLPALGRISYGVYLWHWPLFGWLNSERTKLHGVSLFAVRCVVTLAVGAASYVLVEHPVRAGNWWTSRRPRTAVAAVAAILVTAAAGAFAITTTRAPSVVPSADGSAPFSVPAPASGSAPVDPPVSAPVDPPASEEHVAGSPVVVEVFGDSIAWTLVHYLPAQPELTVRDRTMMGCGIVAEGPYRYLGVAQEVRAECAGWSAQLDRAVAEDNPDVVLILVGRWETMDRVHNGRWTHLGDPEFDAYVRGELERAVEIAASRGARVVLCTEPYNHRAERPDGGSWPEDEPERVNRWNALLRTVASAHATTVRVVDLGGRLSPDGRFTMDVDGVTVRSDGVHLTPAGVRWLAPWLLPQLVHAQ